MSPVPAWLIQNGAIATFAAVVLTVAVRRWPISARLEHLVWAAIALKFVLPPVAPLSVPVLPPAAASVVREPDIVAPVVGEKSPTTQVAATGELDTRVLPRSEGGAWAAPGAREGGRFRLPSLGSVWAVMAGLALVIQLGLWRRWWRRRRLAPAPDTLTALTEEVAAALGVTAPPVRLDEALPVPVICGMVRPILLWPRQLLDRLTEDEARLMLAHELAHLRRGDLRRGLLELLVHSVWWWYPGWLVVSRRLRDAAERDCDTRALALYPALRSRYGRMLLTVLSHDDTPGHALAPGLRGSGSTRRRLEAILVPATPRRTAPWPFLVIALVPVWATPAPQATTAAPAPVHSPAAPSSLLPAPGARLATLSNVEAAPEAAPPRSPVRSDPPDIVAALAHAALDPSPDVRRSVANALRVLDRPDGVEILRRLHDDLDPHVARAARVALGLEPPRPNLTFALPPHRTVDAEELQALTTRLVSGSDDVRREAANTLRNHPDPRTVPALIAASRDPDFHVRQTIASALGASREAEVIPHLLGLLVDVHPRVRQNAAGALWADTEAGDVTTALIAALDDPDDAVRQVAVETLARVALEGRQ